MKNIEKYRVDACPNAYRKLGDISEYVYHGRCLDAHGDCFVCWVQFVNWLLEEHDKGESEK